MTSKSQIRHAVEDPLAIVTVQLLSKKKVGVVYNNTKSDH